MFTRRGFVEECSRCQNLPRSQGSRQSSEKGRAVMLSHEGLNPNPRVEGALELGWPFRAAPNSG